MQNNDSPHILELLRFTETHNRHSEALARATGQHFNIFKILGISRREVTTHSPMLAELLNPKGTHGLDAVFLRLFLDKFKITEFDAKTATVATEYGIGQGEDSGGRVDILIKDGNGKTIVIENKIDAGDQAKQMERYRKRFPIPNAHLFYLTLDGHKPSNLSEDELKAIDCRPISYGGKILEWLKECRMTAVCLPNVRETITQYIHLIEELTNQSTTIAMNIELIKKIIESPESLRAFYTLRNAEVAIESELIARLDAELDEVAKATGLNKQGPLRELQNKNGCFYFTTPGLEQCNLQIGCIFDKGGYSDFCFGLAKKDPTKPCPVEEQVLSFFKKDFPSQSQEPTPYWPAWAYWEEPYKCWRSDAFVAIQSGQFAKVLKAKLEILARIAKQVCPDEAVTQIG